MSVRIQEFTEEWQQPVREFNRRLAQGDLWRPFQFPEDPPDQRSSTVSKRLYDQRWLATEDRAVRGAYILQHRDFWISAGTRTVAHYRLPLSEGVVNRSYANVGVRLLRDALNRQPLLYALGMGGMQHPLPRMLKTMRWSLTKIPFFYKVLRPARFLRNMQRLRNTLPRRLVLDLAAMSGAGVALPLWQRLRTTSLRSDATVEETDSFSGWADRIWAASKASYPFAACRDRDLLNRLYGSQDRHFLRLKINSPGHAIGWAVVLDTAMRSDRNFGNMRLGSIADSFAAPENAHTVIALAAKYLERRGVDLIVANYSHPAWRAALKRSGFLEGPTNFIFAASPELSTSIPDWEAIYLNRGDGDGPINL